jgi:hypothetical protein
MICSERAIGYISHGEDPVMRVEALALRVIADRLDHDEAIPELDQLFAVLT